jgi:hypothetical protein
MAAVAARRGASLYGIVLQRVWVYPTGTSERTNIDFAIASGRGAPWPWKLRIEVISSSVYCMTVYERTRSGGERQIQTYYLQAESRGGSGLYVGLLSPPRECRARGRWAETPIGSW